jgi:enoyl-CoA hydratase
MPERDAVHIELADHVLTITMDRPESRNALGQEIREGLTAGFKRLDEDDDCWVAVLQAEGPTFCAGADLKAALKARTTEGDAAPGPAAGAANRAQPGGGMMGRRRKPVVACVEGHAYAGGLEILMTCDLIVASTDAQFALSEVKRGLLAIGGGLFRLPRRLPYALAMEMILTGAPQTAQTMFDHGLLNRLVEPGAARAAARDLALMIAANSPIAVQAALEVASTAVAERWTDADGFAGQRAPLARVGASEDLMEGLRAFSEKRAPVWKAR